MALKNIRILCLGFLCVSLKSLFFKATKNKGVLSYGFLCFMLFNLSTAQAQSPENGEAAEGQEEMKPLEIGDTIPDELWNLPLQVVNHPEGKEVITLNDYQDKKLIILDFWATSCGSCREALPKLAQLQKQFHTNIQLLPVTSESATRIHSFLKKDSRVYEESLLHVVEATHLQVCFPHRIVPHVVWIGENGKVIHISHGEYVTAENIEYTIKHGELDIPVKIDYHKGYENYTLMSYLADTENNSTPVLQSSILAGYTPFSEIKASFQQDTVAGLTRYFAFNHSLNHLFTLALGSGLPLKPKRCIMNVRNSEKYIYGEGELFFQDWLQKHALSYEAIVPYLADRKEMLARMKSDLEQAFGLHGRMEERAVHCLVLSVRSDKKKVPAKPDSSSVVGSSSIVHVLNENNDLPLVVDGVNDKEIYATLDKEYNTVAELNDILAAFSLALIPEIRNMEMFVLEELQNGYTK